MEKIRISGHTFDLIPMGISSGDKKRSYIISTILSHSEVETAFTDVDKIEHLSETGEVLTTYLDGVGVKTIAKDLESGTYTVTVGVDATERKISELRNEQQATAEALNILFTDLLPMMI